MNRNSISLARTIRGPILLIGLGILLVGDHFAGYSIARTWPLLLILYGALKLLERAADGSGREEQSVS